MNVLFISSWYPTPQNKTHGIFVQRYAQAVAAFHKVAVIHPFGSEDSPDEIRASGNTRENVFEVYVSFRKKNASAFSKFMNYKKLYRVGLDYLLQNWGTPDILQINVFFPAAIAGLDIAKSLKIPFVVSEHWTGYDSNDGGYKGFIRKYFTVKAANHAAKIITVTNDLKQKMISKGVKGNYSVIPNVVDTSIFFRAEKKAERNIFRFLHVSSLDPAQKNVEGLLDVFTKLNQTNPSTELVIVGDGANREVLQTIAGSLFNRSVFFKGEKTGVELATEFNNADCFVMFSNYENLPVVILEALCCGVSVISTKVGGIAEWVNEQNGILIEPRDKGALFTAMENTISSKSRYDVVKIGEHARINFNYSRIAEMFNKVYNEALQKK